MTNYGWFCSQNSPRCFFDKHAIETSKSTVNIRQPEVSTELKTVFVKCCFSSGSEVFLEGHPPSGRAVFSIFLAPRARAANFGDSERERWQVVIDFYLEDDLELGTTPVRGLTNHWTIAAN